VLYSFVDVGRRVNGASTRWREEEGERERKGGAIIVNPTVGLTGFVDIRYCRYRSVELVYPCVDARSWFHWFIATQTISRDAPSQGRGPVIKGLIPKFRGGDDDALLRRVVASLRPS
jgi:hypothetical protein